MITAMPYTLRLMPLELALQVKVDMNCDNDEKIRQCNFATYYICKEDHVMCGMVLQQHRK